MTTTQVSPSLIRAPSRFRQAAGFAWMVLLGGLLGACCVRLWPEWLHNPDLSHGLVLPLVFVILLREAWTEKAEGAHGRANWFFFSALCAGGLLFFLGANLYAAALEWTHSVVLFLLALSAGCFVAAGWLATGRTLSWPACVAALVWPLSAPVPPGTYTRLTQHLQSGVTAAVLFSLHALGITAGRIGNVITLAHVSVGVEEACSGVRSLISCVFAALFLSATLCDRGWKRGVLLVLSAPLALAMNFLRSLLLTLLANNGVEIEGFWHDATGYAILVVTALLLLAIAQVLAQIGVLAVPKSAKNVSVFTNPLHTHPLGGRRFVLAGALLTAFSLWAFFFLKTRPQSRPFAAAPDLAALLPSASPGWSVSTRDDLYHFSSQLQTNALFERSYTRIDSESTLQVTIYVAYWSAGQASVSLVESHTPEACWPGSGWVETPSAYRQIQLTVNGNTLPTGDFRTFHLAGYPQNVWYWHLFDGAVIRSGGASSPRELLSLAWHYGFRKKGEQLFIRVSSNRSWSELAAEPLIQETFRRFEKLGL